MTLIREIIVVIIGLAAGITVAGGVFAFITMLGIIPRLASRTLTASNIYLYELCVIIGGGLGNIFSVYEFPIITYGVGLITFGLFSGIFVGCLAMALAELLKVMPIFSMRIKLKQGMPIVVICIALGKFFGSFFQLYINWGK